MRFPFIRVIAKFIRLFDLFTSEINPSIPLNRPSTITILSLTSNCTFTIGITLPYFRNEVTSSVSLADKGFIPLSLGRKSINPSSSFTSWILERLSVSQKTYPSSNSSKLTPPCSTSRAASDSSHCSPTTQKASSVIGSDADFSRNVTLKV